MPIENPYAKRLPSDRIGRIRTRTGNSTNSSGTPAPPSMSTAAATAAASNVGVAGAVVAAPSSAAVPPRPPNHHCSNAQPPEQPQPQQPQQTQQTQQTQPNTNQPKPQPQQSIPYHDRLPSRRISFSAAEIVTVSELARCLPQIDPSSNNKSPNNNSQDNTSSKSPSVRFTGVVLHVDLVGRFILVGDSAAGARPSASLGVSGAGRGGGIGAGRRMGAGSGRGLGIGRGVGGVGIPSKTPLNRYARSSIGGGIRNASSQRTSLGGGGGGGTLPSIGGAGIGAGVKGLGNRSRRSSVGGVGGGIGTGTGTGSSLLHTAKKRKLVYTGGKKPSAATATAAAGTDAATDNAVEATETPRQGLASSRRPMLPGGILRTPRTIGSGIGSSKRPPGPHPTTLGPGGAALEVVRQHRMRGVTHAMVAVDIETMMPLGANVGWKVGDTVTVFGEVRMMGVGDAGSVSASASSDASSDASMERPAPTAIATTTAAPKPPPSALQLVLSALETNGRCVTARIIRNTNGTDVNLLVEALRLRRKHVRDRCAAGWPMAVGVPGIGIEALVGVNKLSKDEANKANTSGD